VFGFKKFQIVYVVLFIVRFCALGDLIYSIKIDLIFFLKKNKNHSKLINDKKKEKVSYHKLNQLLALRRTSLSFIVHVESVR